MIKEKIVTSRRSYQKIKLRTKVKKMRGKER